MADTLHLKIYLAVNTDIVKLWKEILPNGAVKLGGENGQYTAIYNGDKKTGLKVLAQCMECSGYGKFYADYGE